MVVAGYGGTDHFDINHWIPRSLEWEALDAISLD